MGRSGQGARALRPLRRRATRSRTTADQRGILRALRRARPAADRPRLHRRQPRLRRRAPRLPRRRCGTRAATATCCCTTPTSTCASSCATRASSAGCARRRGSKEHFEIVDFPFSSGVALVRVLTRRLAARGIAAPSLVAAGARGGGYVFWRYVWFFRDPPRSPPAGDGLRQPGRRHGRLRERVEPGDESSSSSRASAPPSSDIVREDVGAAEARDRHLHEPVRRALQPRAALAARSSSCATIPGAARNVHMGAMHWRSLLGSEPLLRGQRAHRAERAHGDADRRRTYRGGRLPATWCRSARGP